MFISIYKTRIIKLNKARKNKIRRTRQNPFLYTNNVQI